MNGNNLRERPKVASYAMQYNVRENVKAKAGPDRQQAGNNNRVRAEPKQGAPKKNAAGSVAGGNGGAGPRNGSRGDEDGGRVTFFRNLDDILDDEGVGWGNSNPAQPSVNSFSSSPSSGSSKMHVQQPVARVSDNSRPLQSTPYNGYRDESNNEEGYDEYDNNYNDANDGGDYNDGSRSYSGGGRENHWDQTPVSSARNRNSSSSKPISPQFSRGNVRVGGDLHVGGGGVEKKGPSVSIREVPPPLPSERERLQRQQQQQQLQNQYHQQQQQQHQQQRYNDEYYGDNGNYNNDNYNYNDNDNDNGNHYQATEVDEWSQGVDFQDNVNAMAPKNVIPKYQNLRTMQPDYSPRSAGQPIVNNNNGNGNGGGVGGGGARGGGIRYTPPPKEMKEKPMQQQQQQQQFAPPVPQRGSSYHQSHHSQHGSAPPLPSEYRSYSGGGGGRGGGGGNSAYEEDEWSDDDQDANAMPNYYTPRNQANANNSKPNPNNRLHQQQQQQQQQSYEVYEGRNAYNAPEYENDYESDRARGIGVKGPKNNAAGQGIPISRKAEAKNVYKGDMNQQHKEKRSSGSNNIPTSTSSNRGGGSNQDHYPAEAKGSYYNSNSNASYKPSYQYQHEYPQSKATSSTSQHNPPPSLPCEAAHSTAQPSISSPKSQLYFSKQPREVEYKPYTLEQYKLIKPKEYMEISNLKPDLNTEELRAKRSNLERIKEFSRNLKNFNKQTIEQQKKLPQATELSEIEISRRKLESNRMRALEFAKNIPKPKPKAQQLQLPTTEENEDEEGYMTNVAFADRFGMDYQQASKIDELEAKHLDGKAKVESIKRSLGL